MAVTSSAVSREVRPEAGRRRGSRASKPQRKRAPAPVPATAGSQGGRPWAAARSMAGSSRLQTLAAVMMPAAKPSSQRRRRSRGSRTKRKTVAAPSVVMAKRNSVPPAAQVKACFMRIPPVAGAEGPPQNAPCDSIWGRREDGSGGSGWHFVRSPLHFPRECAKLCLWQVPRSGGTERLTHIVPLRPSGPMAREFLRGRPRPGYECPTVGVYRTGALFCREISTRRRNFSWH